MLNSLKTRKKKSFYLEYFVILKPKRSSYDNEPHLYSDKSSALHHDYSSGRCLQERLI
jgi:hypothetical protein